MYKLMRVAAIMLATTFWSMTSLADDAIQGKKQVIMLDKKNNELLIGTIDFKKVGDKSKYSLHLDHAKFQDYFLSMKEMKCLEGPELMCQLPYPYKQPNTVTADDFSWLSHDLLFMFKKKEDFGANFWNGIYFDMRIEDGVIKGEAQAVDLNVLAAPPEDLSIPPMGEAERDELDLSKRWLPRLVIK